MTANALGDIVMASKTGMPEKFKNVNGQVSASCERVNERVSEREGA